MKKLNNKAGFSLIEMLLAIAILVLLIVGMQSGLDAGVHAYGESMFESNSAALAGILNSAIGDVLRYAEDIQINPNLLPAPEGESAPDGFKGVDGIVPPEKAQFIFTNYEYGVRDAYLTQDIYRPSSGTSTSTNNIVLIAGMKEDYQVTLVNTGAYPNLEIAADSLKVEFVPSDDTTAGPENYFTVRYTIVDLKEPSRTKDISTTIRLMNPEE